MSEQYEVLAVRYGTRQASAAEVFLNYHVYHELDQLRELRGAGRLTLAGRTGQVAPGIELMQVGGHTPGQAIVTVATVGDPVVLASDAVHYFEELERDRPFSIVASLADMYAAFDQIRELASGGPRVVAGHDPLVADRFGDPPDPPNVITMSSRPSPGLTT